MSVKIKIASVLLLCALVFSLSACAVRLDPPRQMTSVEEAQNMGFSAADYNGKIKVGEYEFLTVNIKLDYQDQVKWSTNNPAVAVVDSSGRVDGIKEGKATITAKAKTATVDYEIEVVKADQAVTSYSTAITANENYLKANLESGMENPYAIIINEDNCSVTVFTNHGDNYKAVRAMVCSTGKTQKTIKNDPESYVVYKTTDKAELVNLSDGKYYRYATYIGDDFMFQSSPYSSESPSSLIAEEYNKLGKPVSSKNIRLSVEDAKWIYDNCKEGTMVRVVNSTNKSTFYPLGVPDGMKLTENSKSLKWDPTDRSKDNPYAKLTPVISGVSDTVVKLETSIDLLEGVTAVDTCGNDISDKITVVSNINVNVEGEYVISYYVTDGMGRTARVDRNIVVTSDEKKLTTVPLTE